MGNSTSSQLPYNDFELVIRVSKQLEQLLEGYVTEAGLSLGQKIDNLAKTFELSQHMVNKMKTLNHWRNLLVHDVKYNSLEDIETSREQFAHDYEQVKLYLNQSLGGSNSNQSRGQLSSGVARKSDNNEGSGTALLFGALAVGGLALASAMNSEDDGETRRRRQQRHRGGW